MRNLTHVKQKVNCKSFLSSPGQSPGEASSEALGKYCVIAGHISAQIEADRNNHFLPDGSIDFNHIKYKQRKRHLVSLHRIAKKLVSKEEQLKRLWNCNTIGVTDTLTLSRNKRENKSITKGLQSCGYVCSCPVCSSRISIDRCNEVTEALGKHLLIPGNGAYMMTFTSSHSRKDPLEKLLKIQGEAYKSFWQHGTIKRLMKSIGTVGKITALEVPYSSKNGFHPHRHVLVFTKAISYSEMKKIEERFRGIWNQILLNLGLRGNKHSFNFQGGEMTDKYVAKLDMELTLGNLKEGRSYDGNQSITAFGMLGYLAKNSWKEKRSVEFIQKFQEYALGMKGKRPLVWSKGLKDHFSINIKSDDEILQDIEENYIPVISYSSYDRKKILVDDLFLDIENYVSIGKYSKAMYLLLAAQVKIKKVYDEVYEDKTFPKIE